MTDNIFTFPQKLVRPGKPSILEILLSMEDPGQAMALVTMCHPSAPIQELIDAVSTAADMMEGRLKDNEQDIAVVESMMKLAGPIMQDNPDMQYREALEILSVQGNEEATAQLSALESPEQVKFDRDMKAAVERDPYWHSTEEGSYTVRKGAVHKTPDALVTAYRQAQVS